MNLHQAHPATPLAMFTSLWQNRELIWQLTRREVAGRYRGSFIGLIWSFLNPVLMLIVYTFVFSFVFKSRWGVGNQEIRADRKSTRLNSSHSQISYAVFCLKKKKKKTYIYKHLKKHKYT